MIRVACTTLLALSLAAQPAPKSAPPTEEATIQRFRAHSSPRKVAPRGGLGPEEQNIVRRFKEAKPSVVFVSAILKERDPRTQDILKIPTGAGSGFVWDEWGHIVTNHHVITWDLAGKRVGDVNEVEVTLSNGKAYKGRVIGVSFAFDIAVIQVFAPLESMRPIPIGRSRDVLEGQTVLAIGNPFGLDHSLSVGVISAKGREIETGYGTRILAALQTDAAVNPGNSGGPLLDSAGRLVGMNTAIVATKGEASVGVGFAIPVDTLNYFVPKLIAHETLQPPRMGFVTMGAFEAQQKFHLSRGVLVTEVEADSPAGRAGLRALEVDAGRVKVMGDILLAYQGHAIENEGQLLATIELDPPGDEAVFDVLRDGQVIKVVLNLRKTKSEEKVQPHPAGI